MSAAANTIGQPASFGFTSSQIMGPGYSPYVAGAGGGTPKDHIAGDANPADTAVGRSAAAAAYGVQAATRNPLQQPAFIYFLLFGVGVVMLAHVAHLSLR